MERHVGFIGMWYRALNTLKWFVCPDPPPPPALPPTVSPTQLGCQPVDQHHAVLQSPVQRSSQTLASCSHVMAPTSPKGNGALDGV